MYYAYIHKQNSYEGCNPFAPLLCREVSWR